MIKRCIVAIQLPLTIGTCVVVGPQLALLVLPECPGRNGRHLKRGHRILTTFDIDGGSLTILILLQLAMVLGSV